MTVVESTTGTDGRVVAIAGPVIDVEFPRGSLPELNTALQFTVQVDDKDVTILAEVAQQLGDSRVRAVCLKPTDGLTRGAPVKNLGRGLSMPVGDGVLGHVLNVLGEPLDVASLDNIDGRMRWGNASELLVSGLLDGGDEIAQHAAVIDSPLERGHVILFSMNPFWRGQTAGSYALVFNTILNFDNLNAGRKTDEK